MVNDKCINRLEAIGIAGLVATRSKPFKCYGVCLVPGAYNILNRPAAMESNFKCFIVVMYV